MILADRTIKKYLDQGEIYIDPFNMDYLQPATYDLTLDKHFLKFDTTKYSEIDTRKPVDDMMAEYMIENDEDPFVLHPKEFALANIFEVTGVSDKIVGRLEGKSSLARLGLIIHTTAGFLDPGNKLRLTLELFNAGSMPIKLYYRMKIAQIAFEELDERCERPYGHKDLGSKYFGDQKVQGSKMHLNFSK